MEIATFNVNSIRARMDLLERWLKEKRAVDLLALQEIKCTEENFPFERFERLGYDCAVFGQKGYNGVAICSKYPLYDIKKGFADSLFDNQKRVIAAKAGDYRIINVYAPHGDLEGEKLIYKLRFFSKLKSYIVENFSLKEKLIVVGDMNVARDDMDVWDPVLLKGSIGFMDEEREAFEDFVSIGLVDTYRELRPNEPGFTWWDYKNGAIWRNQGMRIDYILTSPNAFERCEDIDVDLWTRKRRSPTPSDHAPVVAHFRDE